jgi:hypothetical protein
MCGAVSATFTVAKAGQPLATSLTGLAFTTYASGYTYEWWNAPDGASQRWMPSGISITAPALGVDVNAWYSNVTEQAPGGKETLWQSFALGGDGGWPGRPCQFGD